MSHEEELIATLSYLPDRGRIIMVNFELGGVGVDPEMVKQSRPCLVLQNNKLYRGDLVTVIPISTEPPDRPMPYHHRMDHRSFDAFPISFGRATPRWAKCDYVTTVSLHRCSDPHFHPPYQKRKYFKAKAIAADIRAVEKGILWALGIRPEDHITVPAQ